MSHPSVVAPLRQGGHTRAVDVDRSHARHLEQCHRRTAGDYRSDRGPEPIHEHRIPVERAEGEAHSVDLDVEHIPGAEHHEGDPTVRRSSRPAIEHPLTHHHVQQERS